MVLTLQIIVILVLKKEHALLVSMENILISIQHLVFLVSKILAHIGGQVILLAKIVEKMNIVQLEFAIHVLLISRYLLDLILYVNQLIVI
jgi:hypothetical protein